MRKRLTHWLGRIRVRLFAVMLVALVVPIFGLEFARIYERQLLDGLERDMRNQSRLVSNLLAEESQGEATLSLRAVEEVLVRSAAQSRTRIRVLNQEGVLVADSHRDGAPEGPEPRLNLLGRSYGLSTDPFVEDRASEPWPDVERRSEVRAALEGRPGSYTRIREEHPEVILFVTEPVLRDGTAIGAVYATRSTQPVLIELHQIRYSIVRVLAIAVLICLALALLLAWTISRPLGKLAKASQAIAAGRTDTVVPLTGSGEIRDLAVAIRCMTSRLQERANANADFAADVAHEFKSPLTSIRGAAELLTEGAMSDPAAQDRFLANILLDTERLDRLVSRLLELSRLEASSTTPVTTNLNSFLERLTSRMSSESHPVELSSELGPTFVDLRAPEMELALRNVIENAVRVSPVGATVELTACKSADCLRIGVHDRGPGIPEENRSRVFDRFFTTDAEREGTGLGLAIARTVVEAHGGTLWFDTSPLGSSFFVALPSS